MRVGLPRESVRDFGNPAPRRAIATADAEDPVVPVDPADDPADEPEDEDPDSDSSPDDDYPDPAVARRDALDLELTLLARRAAAGDRVALDRLLRLASPLLLRYCRGKIGLRGPGLSTPEDVAQDIVMAVCTALPRYRDLQTPFMAFAYGIARNKVADAFRVAGRDRSAPSEDVPEAPDGSAGPEQAAVGSAGLRDLMALVDRLPERQREIVVLRVLGERTAEETAVIVGSTPGAVRVAQHRALARLRAWLREG